MKTSGKKILGLTAMLALIVTSSNVFAAGNLQEYLTKPGTQSKTALVLWPSSLEVGSANPLTKTQLDALSAQYRHAARMAEKFSQEKKLEIVRDTMPTRVNLLSSPAEVAQMTNRTENDRLGLVVARINLNQGIVYLGRSNPSDLYMELGKWFFYQPTYKWGQDLQADQEHMAMIKNFAAFCMEEKNWSEDGMRVASLR